MKQLNCDSLEMAIEFDEKQFKRKEFILDVKPKKKDDSLFGYSFGSKSKSRKEHAHMVLNLNGKDSYLKLSYHQDKIEDEDVREPYLEGLTEWIANFFSETSIEANFMIVYKYNKQYESLLPLRYPLLLKNELLQGTAITGHDIDFPKDSIINRASITKVKDGFLIFLFTRFAVDLHKFNVHSSMEKLSEYANALVEKKEDKNERGESDS